MLGEFGKRHHERHNNRQAIAMQNLLHSPLSHLRYAHGDYPDLSSEQTDAFGFSSFLLDLRSRCGYNPMHTLRWMVVRIAADAPALVSFCGFVFDSAVTRCSACLAGRVRLERLASDTWVRSMGIINFLSNGRQVFLFCRPRGGRME
jgi:hypothetical protein